MNGNVVVGLFSCLLPQWLSGSRPSYPPILATPFLPASRHGRHQGHGRPQKLRTKHKENPEAFATLEAIVSADKAGKAGEGLLWLKRGLGGLPACCYLLFPGLLIFCQRMRYAHALRRLGGREQS
jgi:hypothetical protein